MEEKYIKYKKKYIDFIGGAQVSAKSGLVSAPTKSRPKSPDIDTDLVEIEKTYKELSSKLNKIIEVVTKSVVNSPRQERQERQINHIIDIARFNITYFNDINNKIRR